MAQRYELPRIGPAGGGRPAGTRRRELQVWLMVGAVCVLLLWVLGCQVLRHATARRSAPPPPLPHVALATNAPPAQKTEAQYWTPLFFPTAQQHLLDPAHPEVFQPTASGNPESGRYGSVRMVKRGMHWISSFHEGIDIAALRRDNGGRPLDKVYAVTGGTVGYASRVAGNSAYGKYVVLLHPDPLGSMYTLYAHLAEIRDDIQAGRPVRAGQEIGVMGNTSSSPIPRGRAHLHFEVGLVVNQRFAQWAHAAHIVPDHGNFNGQNLEGINPLTFLSTASGRTNFTFRECLARIPPAYALVFKAAREPDFFRRYPGLWQGEGAAAGWMAVTCAEGGAPLGGRPATVEEIKQAGTQGRLVCRVDPAVLGKNGMHLIVPRGRNWELTAKGGQWVEVFCY